MLLDERPAVVLLEERVARLVEEAEKLVVDNAGWVLLEDTLEKPDEVLLGRLAKNEVCKLVLDMPEDEVTLTVEVLLCVEMLLLDCGLDDMLLLLLICALDDDALLICAGMELLLLVCRLDDVLLIVCRLDDVLLVCTGVELLLLLACTLDDVLLVCIASELLLLLLVCRLDEVLVACIERDVLLLVCPIDGVLLLCPTAELLLLKTFVVAELDSPEEVLTLRELGEERLAEEKLVWPKEEVLLDALLTWLDVAGASVLELEVDEELAFWLTVMNPLDDDRLVDDEVTGAALEELDAEIDDCGLEDDEVGAAAPEPDADDDVELIVEDCKFVDEELTEAALEELDTETDAAELVDNETTGAAFEELDAEIDERKLVNDEVVGAAT